MRVAVFSVPCDRAVHPAASNICTALTAADGIHASPISPTELLATQLRGYDAVCFPGGCCGQQSSALGARGRQIVREFVANGGGYIGVCAGAFLAASGYNNQNSLRLLQAKWTHCALWSQVKCIDDRT